MVALARAFVAVELVPFGVVVVVVVVVVVARLLVAAVLEGPPFGEPGLNRHRGLCMAPRSRVLFRGQAHQQQEEGHDVGHSKDQEAPFIEGQGQGDGGRRGREDEERRHNPFQAGEAETGAGARHDDDDSGKSSRE